MTECVDWLWLHVTENVRYPVSALQDEDFRSRVSLPFVPSFFIPLRLHKPKNTLHVFVPLLPSPNLSQNTVFSGIKKRDTNSCYPGQSQ